MSARARLVVWCATSAIALLALLAPALAAAQSGTGGEANRPALSGSERLRSEDRQGPPLAEGGVMGQRRQMIEQQVRRRFAEVVRNQLQLDHRQMQHLMDVNRKFEGRRRDMNVRERESRQQLRGEVERDKQADNPRVATALQQLLAIQKERAALLEDEDKDLSGFLTPVQRARYLALQEQLRRRVEEMRRRAAAGLDPMDPPGAPPEPPEPPGGD